MFGAGGGTSSYREAEDADLIVMWGSNAREAHPIFFHHVLKDLRNGARMYAVDPRRSSPAQWADAWLGLDVGTDVSLANAIAREIIEAGLVNEAFVRRATTGYEAYATSVQPYTLARAERDTGVPASVIRQRDRRDAGVRRCPGARRHGRPRRAAAADRPVLPRRILRSVRAPPAGHRAPGGAAATSTCTCRTTGSSR